MQIKDFKLERYFAIHEFTAKYLLSSSDCDGYSLDDVLSVASREELKLWEGMQFGYTESQGHPLLREAILEHYELNDIEQVLVASPGELNFISMNVLLQANDHVISVAPAYQSLYEIVRSIKCDLSFWNPDPENWQFNVDELEKLIQENTKLIILNVPHNPTGSYLTVSQQEAIIELARKHELYIFSDEMYCRLMLGTTEELPSICDKYEKGITLWGTSKTFGLAGLRTGWLVSQDQGFLKKVLAFKDYLSICNSAPSEILSIIALNHINDFLIPNLTKIRSNIELFNKFATEQALIEQFIPPRAGSTAFVKLNINRSSLAFSNELVEKTGIMTVPGEMFEYEGKYIRVGFGRKVFPEILERLDEFLKADPKFI